MAAGHSLFEALGVAKEFKYFGAAAMAGGILTGIGLYVRAKANTLAEGDALPEAKFNVFNILVEVLQYFRKLLRQMIGEHSEQYLWLLATTFVFIFVSNFMGMFPGLLSPTSDFANNLAMAIIMVGAYHLFGFREHGVGYIKHFFAGMPLRGNGALIFGITLFMAPMLFVLEIFSHSLRLGTLPLRLWGVVNGDHTFEHVLSSLFPIGLPIAAMTLGLVVCVVQALVFTLLSTVYIQMAVSHDH